MTDPRFLHRFSRNGHGGAAVEMALVCMFLALGIMNVTELGRYSYARMQMSAASQAAVSAAFAACDTAHVPATLRCPGLNTAVSNAVHSSGLAGNIEVQGSITEGWYCLNLAHQLEYIASPASVAPTDCAAVNNIAARPALYMGIIVVNYYNAMFPDVTVVSALPTTMTKAAWMRML